MSNQTRPIVFLGGVFTPRQMDFIAAQSRGVVQNAADALQKNLLQGLSVYRPSIAAVNLPFIGSYPRLFMKRYFPGTVETLEPSIRVLGKGFILVRFIKSYSRLAAALAGLWRADPERCSAIIIYSAHPPFLLAALLYRFFFRNTRTCLILPDFPEFMGEGGRLYTIAKAVESKLFYFLARRIDMFVLLTRFMAERLQISEQKYVVVEGIADAPVGDDRPIVPVDESQRIFLYAGTLAARYGVMQMVDAFKKVRNANAQLWICGDGDSRERIIKAGQHDQRIRFFGQVTRGEARQLQLQATVLVNPRLPTGDFTRYSFPSKTMEYMASGRPVLMHRLPGMPDEYLPYFVQPKSTDIDGLAAAIEDMAQWDAVRLDAFGAASKSFVLEEKNAATQCKKIIDLIASFD